jgi:hypothetical protein
LPFSGLVAAKPAQRFYADVSAATRSVCNALFDGRTTNLCNFSGEADPVSRQRRDSRYIL